MSARKTRTGALLATDGDRYFVPRYTGKSGWIGIRFAAIEDWDEVAELVEESWRMTAPKKLVAQLEASTGTS